MNIGIQRELGHSVVVRADYLHNYGTHFIIGRTIGQVFNPVVGGPDLVKNLESSVKTKYDGMLITVEKRFSHRSQFRASYTLSKSFNYANDDQIPFSNGPLNSNNLQLEYGPTPNDQRHRFTFAGALQRLAPEAGPRLGAPQVASGLDVGESLRRHERGQRPGLLLADFQHEPAASPQHRRRRHDDLPAHRHPVRTAVEGLPRIEAGNLRRHGRNGQGRQAVALPSPARRA